MRKGSLTATAIVLFIALFTVAGFMLNNFMTQKQQLTTGQSQQALMQSYDKGEEALMYLDESAKLATSEAIYETLIHAGHQQSICGSILSPLWLRNNTLCVPDYEQFFLEQFETSLDRYLTIHPTITYPSHNTVLLSTTPLVVQGVATSTLNIPVTADMYTLGKTKRYVSDYQFASFDQPTTSMGSRRGEDIALLIVARTQTDTVQNYVDDAIASGNSFHYVIDQEGQVTQHVSELEGAEQSCYCSSAYFTGGVPASQTDMLGDPFFSAGQDASQVDLPDDEDLPVVVGDPFDFSFPPYNDADYPQGGEDIDCDCEQTLLSSIIVGLVGSDDPITPEQQESLTNLLADIASRNELSPDNQNIIPLTYLDPVSSAEGIDLQSVLPGIIDAYESIEHEDYNRITGEATLYEPTRQKIESYSSIIARSAHENKVDASFIKAVITQESSGNPEAVSWGGCAGLMQFCQTTAQRGPYIDYFEQITRCYDPKPCRPTCSDNSCLKYYDGACHDFTTGAIVLPVCNLENDGRFDPEKSIMAGGRLLSENWNYFEGYAAQVPLAIASYNAGSTVLFESMENLPQKGKTSSWYEISQRMTPELICRVYNRNLHEDSAFRWTQEACEGKKEEVENYVTRVLGYYSAYSGITDFLALGQIGEYELTTSFTVESSYGLGPMENAKNFTKQLKALNIIDNPLDQLSDLIAQNKDQLQVTTYDNCSQNSTLNIYHDFILRYQECFDQTNEGETCFVSLSTNLTENTQEDLEFTLRLQNQDVQLIIDGDVIETQQMPFSTDFIKDRPQDSMTRVGYINLEVTYEDGLLSELKRDIGGRFDWQYDTGVLPFTKDHVLTLNKEADEGIYPIQHYFELCFTTDEEFLTYIRESNVAQVDAYPPSQITGNSVLMRTGGNELAQEGFINMISTPVGVVMWLEDRRPPAPTVSTLSPLYPGVVGVKYDPVTVYPDGLEVTDVNKYKLYCVRDDPGENPSLEDLPANALVSSGITQGTAFENTIALVSCQGQPINQIIYVAVSAVDQAGQETLSEFRSLNPVDFIEQLNDVQEALANIQGITFIPISQDDFFSAVEPAAFRADEDFLLQREGRNLEPLIPRGSDGEILGQSGVTFYGGVDVGQYSAGEIDTMRTDCGLPEDLSDYIDPFLGLKREAAQNSLDSYTQRYGVIRLTDAEGRQMYSSSVCYKSTQIDDAFERRNVGYSFEELSRGQQTAILSFTYQYGPYHRIERWWNYLREKDWQAYADYMDELSSRPGYPYQDRRREEASYLREHLWDYTVTSSPSTIT